jgi:hypothetical protein
MTSLTDHLGRAAWNISSRRDFALENHRFTRQIKPVSYIPVIGDLWLKPCRLPILHLTHAAFRGTRETGLGDGAIYLFSLPY